jgi:hypothetical protein
MNRILILTLGLIGLLFGSCQKDDIPTPDTTPNVSGEVLFITGLNGDSIVVDGISYSSASGVFGGQPNLYTWSYAVGDELTGDTIAQINMIDTLTNAAPNINTVIEATSGNSLELMDLPSNGIHKKFYVSYWASTNDHYCTWCVTTSNPTIELDIIDTKDTIIDNVSYRIVEFSGPILLESSVTFDQLVLNDFHARIAFSQ